MLCPKCGKKKSEVDDTKITPDGMRVSRKRKCKACGERFRTYELRRKEMEEMEDGIQEAGKWCDCVRKWLGVRGLREYS